MNEIIIKTSKIFELDTKKVVIGYDTNVGTIKLGLRLFGCYPKLLDILASPDLTQLLPVTFKVNASGSNGAYVAYDIKSAKDVAAEGQ